MKPLKKIGMVAITSLLCLSLFSFKSMETNEKELYNVKNFSTRDFTSDINELEEDMATGAVGRLAVKAWQKSSREVVYAAVALWPLSRAEDNLVNLKIDYQQIQESKLSKL